MAGFGTKMGEGRGKEVRDAEVGEG